MLLDRDGDAILISDRTPLKGAIKDEFKGTGLGYRRFYPRIDDIRQYMPDVWLLTPQNLYRSLYEWKTGPLQRLSGMLANKFLSTPWEFEFGGKNRKMPDALVKAYEFFRASVEAFPFWQNDLKPKLEDTLSRYVGGQARVALRPDVQEIEDWLAQQLVASFAAEGTGAAIPLQNMGDGWQTLVRLAALDVLSQYPEQVSERVLLLMEEPETYLHPHLCRRMRTVLGELAQQGWTVLTATHGPELTSFAQPQLIVKLWRKGDTVSKGVFDTGLTPDALKFQEKLDELGNHEMLFANKIVLCEGKGDCWAIRSGLGKLSADLDLDANSISVVATGSVGNLPDYAAMAKQLGIPWCAVSDEDKKPGEPVNPVTEGIRRKVVDLLSPTDLSAIWPGDLEACLGTPAGQKATPEWQAKHTDPKPLADMQAEHPNFIATCSSVEAWLRA